MEKIFGATERHDQLLVYGTNRALLIYGYGEENGQGYDYRHVFDHKPTEQEIRDVIIAQINADTDRKILTGFVWTPLGETAGMNVWLSTENEFNFKAAYDLAIQTGGATLPVKFKLGEDESGYAVYHTFISLEEFTDFYTKAIAYVNQTLNEGWQEKDNIDMKDFGYE